MFSSTGGVAVIQHLMHTRLGQALSAQEAQDLWTQCQAVLEQRGLQETVEEVCASTSGRLDTLVRDDVLDVLGRVLAGQRWPTFGATPEQSDQFARALRAGLAARGYAELPV